MKICEKCGIENDDNSKFCTTCGNPLPEAAAVVEEVIAEPVEEFVEEPVIEAKPDAESVAAPVPVPAPAPVPVQTVQTPAVKPPKKGEHTVKGRAFGIIGFILNLEALLCSVTPFVNFGALVYSIIGLIFCGVSKNNTHFRLTKVAKILGILALVFSILTIILYGVLAYLGIYALINDPQVQDSFERFFESFNY